MSDDRIAEIRARVEAATDGPWHDCAIDPNGCGGWDQPPDHTIPKAPTGSLIQSAVHTSSEAVIQASNYDNSPWCLPEDRAFIAHSPTDMRYLLARLAAKDAEIARLREALERLIVTAHNDRPRTLTAFQNRCQLVRVYARAALSGEPDE